MDLMKDAKKTNLSPLVGEPSSRTCTTCGHRNPAATDDCLNCGAALDRACPVCRQRVPGGDRFCVQCGARLPDTEQSEAALNRPYEVRQNLRALMPAALAQKISGASAEIMGERREVTVLVANVTNFTTAFTLDNEESFNLMDELLRLLVEVVYQYEGSIDKFKSDGLVALFGAPVAHENDPERAIRTALDMQQVIRPWQARIQETYRFDFQLRIGINTGQVIAGKVGNDLHMDYTVIGETVNLAYNLELVAEPDSVLVSAETYHRTRPLFEFQALPPLAIEWLPQPVKAFRPLGLRRSMRPGTDLSALPSPMIGRATELKKLQDALEAVRRQQQGRTALITGEAGLGKSRLVAELRRLLPAREVSVFQGSSPAYARSAPLGIIAQILREVIHLSEADLEAVQQETLCASLEQLDLPVSGIFPYLAHLLGLPQADDRATAQLLQLDPAALQRQTHAALRQVFLAKARHKPTILIFEDLHWMDPASRDFLAYLIQTCDDVPLMLLLVSRQAERETILKPLLAAADQQPERLLDLPLQVLSTAESQALAEQLIPQTTAEATALKEQIAARANGNPFYVGEIIRTLIEQGGLERSQANGAWQVTEQAGDLLKIVPGNIKGIILARFDRLPETLRVLLQKAAVIGTAFPVELLQHLCNLKTEIVSDHLRQLATQEFFYAGPFRSASGYQFQHALLQETIYGTLLRRDRAKIHGQVARAIEQTTLWLPEERAEALAYHYAESDRPIQAIPFLLAAGNNAARRCAFETSVAHYRRAVDLTRDQANADEAYFQARLGLGRSLKFLGDFNTAGEVLTEALRHLWFWDKAAEPESLRPILVGCLRQLADIRQREGQYDQAISYLESGLQVLGETAAEVYPGPWRSVLDRMAWIRFRQGRLAEAAQLANDATAKLDPAQADDPIRLASLYNTLGGIGWQQGRLQEAMGFVERSLSLHESVGYLWGTAVACVNLGILNFVSGNWPRAADYYERGYYIQQLIGNPEGQAVCLDNLGLLFIAQGAHESARQNLEQGLSIRCRLGDSWGTAQSNVNLARLAIEEACFDDAAEYAETALRLAEEIGSKATQIYAHQSLALVQAEQDQPERALDTARQALEMAQTAEHKEGEIDSLRVLGGLAARAGRYDLSETHLRHSHDLCLKQQAPYRLGLACYELGRLYQNRALAQEQDSHTCRTKAKQNLDEAAALFTELGAAHDLQQVQAALAQIESIATS